MMKKVVSILASLIFATITHAQERECFCTSRCLCVPDYEECGCGGKNWWNDNRVIRTGEEIGTRRDSMELAFGYMTRFERSSAVSGKAYDFFSAAVSGLFGKCRVKLPSKFSLGDDWSSYGSWIDSYETDNVDEWRGDLTKYERIYIPVYDSADRLSYLFIYNNGKSKDEWESILLPQGYKAIEPGPEYRTGDMIFQTFNYIRIRNGVPEVAVVGTGRFGGWCFKMKAGVPVQRFLYK